MKYTYIFKIIIYTEILILMNIHYKSLLWKYHIKIIKYKTKWIHTVDKQNFSLKRYDGVHIETFLIFKSEPVIR